MDVVLVVPVHLHVFGEILGKVLGLTNRITSQRSVYYLYVSSEEYDDGVTRGLDGGVAVHDVVVTVIVAVHATKPDRTWGNGAVFVSLHPTICTTHI